MNGSRIGLMVAVVATLAWAAPPARGQTAPAPRAATHAAADTWVTVERANGEVRFAVEDDGRGFDLEAVESDKHLGLAIIRARAERSGGCLSIASTRGSGTRVTAAFPVEEAAP